MTRPKPLIADLMTAEEHQYNLRRYQYLLRKRNREDADRAARSTKALGPVYAVHAPLTATTVPSEPRIGTYTFVTAVDDKRIDGGRLAPLIPRPIVQPPAPAMVRPTVDIRF
jgi:hypothetical protein